MEYKNNEQGQEQEYSLYTEKIVLSPKIKYKRLIKNIELLVFIIVIGVMYIVSDKLIIPMVKDKLDKKNEMVDHIEFIRDEYPDIAQMESEEVLNQIKRDYDSIIQSLRSRIDDVQKTIVIVKESTSDEGALVSNDIEDIQNNMEHVQNKKEIFSTIGLIVGHLNGRYMILTSQDYTESVKDYDVVVQEGNAYKAEFVCSDEITGVSIISINDTQVAEADKQYMKVATLDNSYILNQGDMVIAAGKIYGTSGAVDYGTITSKATYNSVDNNYQVFETNLSSQPGDYGFLFNSEGNVVGISQTNSDIKLKAIGISDLKNMVECMINRQGKMYFGIWAQNVDSELSENNGIPMGIYISKVDSESPAYDAGLQPGDVIQGINNMPCYSIQRLNDKIYDSYDGEVLNVNIKRKGKSGYFEVSYEVSVRLK